MHSWTTCVIVLVDFTKQCFVHSVSVFSYDIPCYGIYGIFTISSVCHVVFLYVHMNIDMQTNVHICVFTHSQSMFSEVFIVISIFIIRRQRISTPILLETYEMLNAFLDSKFFLLCASIVDAYLQCWWRVSEHCLLFSNCFQIIIFYERILKFDVYGMFFILLHTDRCN